MIILASVRVFDRFPPEVPRGIPNSGEDFDLREQMSARAMVRPNWTHSLYASFLFG